MWDLISCNSSEAHAPLKEESPLASGRGRKGEAGEVGWQAGGLSCSFDFQGALLFVFFS